MCAGPRDPRARGGRRQPAGAKGHGVKRTDHFLIRCHARGTATLRWSEATYSYAAGRRSVGAPSPRRVGNSHHVTPGGAGGAGRAGDGGSAAAARGRRAGLQLRRCGCKGAAAPGRVWRRARPDRARLAHAAVHSQALAVASCQSREAAARFLGVTHTSCTLASSSLGWCAAACPSAPGREARALGLLGGGAVPRLGA